MAFGSKRLKKPSQKGKDYMAGKGKASKKGGKPFSANGKGGECLKCVMETGFVDGTTTLAQLYKEHGDEQCVAELEEFNQNSLRSAFAKARNEKYNSRDAVEASKVDEEDEKKPAAVVASSAVKREGAASLISPQAYKKFHPGMEDRTNRMPIVEQLPVGDDRVQKQLVVMIQFGIYIKKDSDITIDVCANGSKLRVSAPRSYLMSDMGRVHEGLVFAGMQKVLAMHLRMQVELSLSHKREHIMEVIREVCYIDLLYPVLQEKKPWYKLLREKDDSAVVYVMMEIPGNKDYATLLEDNVVELPTRTK